VPGQAGDALGQRRDADTRCDPVRRRQRAQDAEQVGAPAGHGARPYAGRPEDVGTEPIAAALCQPPDGNRGGRGQVALLHGRRAEVHTRRGVDERPGLQLTVGDDVTDVHLGGAGRDVPVDVSGVVLAGDVGAGVGGLAPRPGQQPQMVAVEETVDPVEDEQLQPAQRGLG
jgi:hypothetical protein